MPLRSKLVIFSVVVLLLFLGLTAGSFLSLSAASRDAETAREELEKLSGIELLESRCARLGAAADPIECERARRALDDLLHRDWRERSRAQIERIAALCADFSAGGDPPDAGKMQRLVADLKASVLEQVDRDLRMAEEPTHRRAVRLLVAAGLAAAGCACTFAWLYARLVRERRSLEDRVRRSEKLAALGTLAAGVAHEINNPLTSISMSAEALGDRLPADSEEAVYVGAINEEASRCLAIVGDLSDLARGGSLDREPVDPEELAEAALKIVRRSRDPGSDPVRFEATVAPGLPLLVADRGKVLQVLLNLLQNAADASPSRGVVRLAVAREDGVVSFAVADEGRGIPDHLLERIFEPFFTDKARGVGLGLTLCHRIAELHGGELAAESDGPGRGSVFTLTLPLEPRDGE